MAPLRQKPETPFFVAASATRIKRRRGLFYPASSALSASPSLTIYRHIITNESDCNDLLKFYVIEIIYDYP